MNAETDSPTVLNGVSIAKTGVITLLSETHREQMRALAAERQSKWTYVVLDDFPKLTTIKEPVILGTFTWNLTKSKVRFIDKKSIIDIGFGIQTPPEISRDYISVVFPKRLRAYSDQIVAFTVPKRHAVLYAKPGRLLKGVYIDISAAYWNITRIVGYNVEYFPPNRWLGQGRHVEDFPLPQHKVARSSIVSQGLIRPLLMWDGERLIEPKKIGGKSVNQALWAIVQDVLHAIAGELKEKCQLVYAHTDGFIVPSHFQDLALSIISSYGLYAKVKQDAMGNRASGLTYVMGVGRYIVGNVRTLNTDTIENAAFDNIQELANREWLRERMMHFANKRLSIKLDDILVQ